MTKNSINCCWAERKKGVHIGHSMAFCAPFGPKSRKKRNCQTESDNTNYKARKQIKCVWKCAFVNYAKIERTKKEQQNNLICVIYAKIVFESIRHSGFSILIPFSRVYCYEKWTFMHFFSLFFLFALIFY